MNNPFGNRAPGDATQPNSTPIDQLETVLGELGAAAGKDRDDRLREALEQHPDKVISAREIVDANKKRDAEGETNQPDTIPAPLEKARLFELKNPVNRGMFATVTTRLKKISEAFVSDRGELLSEKKSNAPIKVPPTFEDTGFGRLTANEPTPQIPVLTEIVSESQGETFKEKITRHGLGGVLRGCMKTTADVPVPVQATEERPIPNNLTQTSLGHTTKNNTTGLSSIEAALLKETNPADLIKQQNANPIDVAVDVAIKNDLNKLREASRAQRARKENQQERLNNWKERLEKVTATTKNNLETTLEKLGPAGKKLVSLFTRGSEYINSNVDKKTKYFAGAGLLAAGSMAVYATPLVVTAIGATALAMRVVSAAGMYKFVRKELDTKYTQWEKEGIQQSALAKAGREAGAIGFALFAGEFVGKTFEGLSHLASLPVVTETLGGIGATVKETSKSVVDFWKDHWDKATSFPDSIQLEAHAPPVATPTPSPSLDTPTTNATLGTENTPASVLESVETPANPDLQHVVKKGDSLWSLLRKDLAGMNLEGFEELSQGAKERMMREILDNTSVPSGNIDKIYPGDTVDFNKVDFKAYLARYLDK